MITRTPSLKIIFAGTPEFAAVALKALLETEHEVCAVYTQPDRPAGRGRKLQASSVKLLAQTHAIPVCQPASLKAEQTQKELFDWQADVMVVAAYGLLLPANILANPRLGCINIHASLLPRWRGAAPIQRAILAGDADTGISIMQMDEGLDTGDVLMQASCEISMQDTAASLHDRLALLGAKTLIEILPKLLNQTCKLQPQNESLVTYAAKLQKSEAELDWNLSAEILVRQVRAFNPWPVAKSTIEGKTLRVWQAKLLKMNSADITPGKILASSSKGIEVACKEGVLSLQRVQLAGSKPMQVEAFLNGHADLVCTDKHFS